MRQDSSRLSMFCRHLRVAGLAQGPTHTLSCSTRLCCPQLRPKENTQQCLAAQCVVLPTTLLQPEKNTLSIVLEHKIVLPKAAAYKGEHRH